MPSMINPHLRLREIIIIIPTSEDALMKWAYDIANTFSLMESKCQINGPRAKKNSPSAYNDKYPCKIQINFERFLEKNFLKNCMPL